MRQVILSPVGRAEPDDVHGWLEQGGGLGLQMAWHMSPAALRLNLSRIQRRDGVGKVIPDVRTPAKIAVQLSNPVQRYLAAEMPALILEGALIWARACEQTSVTILIGQDSGIRKLWQEVASQLVRIGVIGRNGWTKTGIEFLPESGVDIHSSPDALTTRLFPFVLWEHADPPVTLLYAAGNFGNTAVYEIPLGLTVRDFVFNWAGGIPADGRLSLGGRLLQRTEWNLPFSYEPFGVNPGIGVLVCL